MAPVQQQKEACDKRKQSEHEETPSRQRHQNKTKAGGGSTARSGDASEATGVVRMQLTEIDAQRVEVFSVLELFDLLFPLSQDGLLEA